MTAYELCQNYRRIILNRAAEVMNYTWDPEFCALQIREIPEVLKGKEGFELIDTNDLTEEQMKNLDFGLWSEENPIRLIPLWLYPFLKEEFASGDISDGPVHMVKKSEIDTDHRFGCLAYGVMPKKAD